MTEDHRYTAELSITDVTDELHEISVVGQEEVSRPFGYEISFDCLPLVLEPLRGAGAHLIITDRITEAERHVTGVIREAEIELRPNIHAGETVRHRITVVPEVYLALSHRRGYRIFQDDLDVKGIVEKVCTDAGLPAELFAWDL